MSGILAALAGIKTAIATAVDEYFNRTTLLLNTSSTNGAQNNTFLDSSTNNFTITRNGNTTQGTFTPFSQTGWSNYFDGSSYLTAPSGAAVSGNSAFTVEFWVYLPVANTGARIVSGAANQLTINVSSDGSMAYGKNGVVDVITVAAGTSLIGQWTHIAIGKSGASGTARIWRNGTSIGTATDSQTYTAGTVYIGSTSVPGNYLTGYISNLRITNTDVYGTSNTTITVPTTPLTAISGTSLLTSQDNRFKDNSTNAFAITTNGTPSVQAFSPFAPTAAYSTSVVGGSGYFDGSGDYLTSPSSSAYQFDSGDFTVEAWIYFNNVANAQFASIPVVGALYWQYYAGALDFGNNAGGSVQASWSPKAYTWYHLAAVRNGSTFTHYINGAVLTSGTAFNVTATGTLQIGYGGAGTFNGYMAGFRFVKGTAVYTAAFTPPTAPPTAITNTTFLLNFTNSGIYDSAAKNDLETVGNAQVSTTQAKWGTTSMYFDGTGDSLKGKLNNAIGGGDYTIEGWLYTGASGARYIFDMRETSQYLGAFTVGTTLYVNIGTTLDISATTSYPQNTWVHFAMVRSGSATNNTSVFLGGSRITQVTDTTNYSIIPTLYVGNDNTGAYSWSGYIDDFRITKGYARYSGSTYTPPTAAFPVQ